MNTSGEKHVWWVTINDAVVELINTSPGTFGPMGFPWYHVVVTIDVRRFFHVPFDEVFKMAARKVDKFELNNVVVRSDIVRVSWDYNHLWDTESSHKLWKVHAGRYMEELEKLLLAGGNGYRRTCQRCDAELTSLHVADLSGIPEPHFWVTLCVPCEKIVRDELASHDIAQ